MYKADEMFMEPKVQIAENACLAAFQQALEIMGAEELPIIELRPKEKTLGAIVTGDYDFAIARSAIPRVLKIFVKACLMNNVDLEYHQNYPNKKVIIIRGECAAIVIELWPKIELEKNKIKQEMDVSKIFQMISLGQQAEANTILSAIYITHIAYKNKNVSEPLQQERMTYFKALLQASSIEMTGEKKKIADTLLAEYDQVSSETCSINDIEKANKVAVDVLESFGIRLVTFRQSMTRGKFKKVGSNKIRRIIPVLGADGAGKTYLCEHIVNGSSGNIKHKPFKAFFRYGLDYRVLMRAAKKVGLGESNNVVDERMPFYVALKSSMLLAAYDYYLALKKRRLIIDRYLCDYFITNIRRDGAPRTIRGYYLAFKLLPKPSKLVVVMAKVETILARKEELTEEKILFIYNFYTTMVAEGYGDKIYFYNSENNVSAKDKSIKEFIYSY